MNYIDDTNVIVYKNINNSVSIITPTKEALAIASLHEVAEKDVPFGLPYWITDVSTIPTDRTFRDAWEIDESFGAPDGFGGDSNEFSNALLTNYLGVNNDKY